MYKYGSNFFSLLYPSIMQLRFALLPACSFNMDACGADPEGCVSSRSNAGARYDLI